MEDPSPSTTTGSSSTTSFSPLPPINATPSPDVVTPIDRGTLTIYRSAAISSLRSSLSPASLYSCRIASFDQNKLFVATKNRIITVNLDYPEPTSADGANHEGYKVPLPISIDSYKEGFAQEVSFTKSEIQSLVLQNTVCSISGLPSRLAAIDSVGNAWVASICVNPTTNLAELSPENSLMLTASNTAESGWWGLAFHPSNYGQIATVGFWSKKITIFSEDKAVRTFAAVANPTQIRYMSSPHSQEPLLILTEQNVLSVWDIRSPHPCIQRVNANAGTAKNKLYALASKDTEVAIGGSERVVSFVDTRRWTFRSHTKNALKYEITSLEYSSIDDRLCFVGGIGSELACIDSSKTTEKMPRDCIFRGESARWLGIHKLDRRDTLFGLADTGMIYSFHNASALYPFSTAVQKKKRRHSVQKDKSPKVMRLSASQ
eukprot:TRINITY_DN9889_c0_g1_i1.p1 TRINITY_DN9889_c0_g1~~TRINITY_DN9889_c0_g1_i1.p1  ORF type:complete len:447 (-),score=82.18 TRINITY_DN9889_c0_g1_i1:42-1337(-)